MRSIFRGAFAICTILFLVPATIWASLEVADPDGASGWETILVERGQTIDEFLPQAGRGYASTDLNPGIDPEGDYLSFAAFTPDGDQVWVTNRLTDNVTVYDCVTEQVPETYTVCVPVQTMKEVHVRVCQQVPVTVDCCGNVVETVAPAAMAPEVVAPAAEDVPAAPADEG